MLSFDLADGMGDWGSVGVMSDYPTVYASTDSLYLATPKARLAAIPAIHRFDIREPLSPTYFGSGAVRGHLLSQWSMSEHDGYLRVATTIHDRWPTLSNVFVLAPSGEGGDGDEGSLEQVGLVSGLGVTEEIKSVRFAGDVGYVVTFRLTDPLYVLDLSDPTEPQVAWRAEDSRLLQVPASAQRRVAVGHRARRGSEARAGSAACKRHCSTYPIRPIRNCSRCCRWATTPSAWSRKIIAPSAIRTAWPGFPSPRTTGATETTTTARSSASA